MTQKQRRTFIAEAKEAWREDYQLANLRKALFHAKKVLELDRKDLQKRLYFSERVSELERFIASLEALEG